MASITTVTTSTGERRYMVRYRGPGGSATYRLIPDWEKGRNPCPLSCHQMGRSPREGGAYAQVA